MPYKEKSKGVWTGRWIAQVKIAGKVHIHRSRTRKEALAWEEQRRNQGPVEASEPTRTVSLHDWATAYLDYAQSRFVQKTYEEKRLAFRELFMEVPSGLLPENFKPNDARNFLEKSCGRLGGNAGNKRRKNLRAAWEWGKKFLCLPINNPFDAVPRFAEVRNERHVPTLEEFWKVYNVATGSDRAMLLTCLHTGARRNEVFRLQWRDVDFTGGRLRLRWRKNNAGEWRESWLPMTDDLVEALKKQRQMTGLLKFVFMCSSTDGTWVPYQYRQHWLKKLCTKTGVQPFGFHGIRHLFASILASRNVPLVEIQKMLRHGSIQTTARYIHSLQEGSREAIEALPSVASGHQPAIRNLS
jgi:integrase